MRQRDRGRRGERKMEREGYGEIGSEVRGERVRKEREKRLRKKSRRLS